MYTKEVLEKWPVVQHLFFGTCFPWRSSINGSELPSNVTLSDHVGEEESAAILGATAAPWAVSKGRRPLEMLGDSDRALTSRLENLEN